MSDEVTLPEQGGESERDVYTVNNLAYYVIGATVPKEARRDFTRPGGFSGTDINAMWRIKAITQMFGPCGIGWYTEIVKRWTEYYEETGERKVYCDINLYVRDPSTGEWSKPITGTGGNSVILSRTKKDRDGKIVETTLMANDEMYKMAETDAFGSACKKLGIGANVYWSADKTKYTITEDGNIIEYIPSQEEIRAENRAKKFAQAGSFLASKKEEKPVSRPSSDREVSQMIDTIVKMQTDGRPGVKEAVTEFRQKNGGLMSKWSQDAVSELYDRVVEICRSQEVSE